jgi:hypothetical protein
MEALAPIHRGDFHGFRNVTSLPRLTLKPHSMSDGSEGECHD